ncbi:MAG TPA: ABC transporter ATP-binding protein, partial [Stellaceae bacterium]
FGLFGPGGAGKTTILRILSGLVSPTTGVATCAGLDLRTAPAVARARLGYVSQKFSLYGELSIAQNLRFFAAAYRVERRRRGERVDRLLAEFGLEAHADVRAGELPPGLRQRLALAASLVHEPGIVLLDEPTAGVDPLTAHDIWRRIGALAGSGVAVVVASRFLDEAEYCDRLLLIYRGRSIAAGRPDELTAPSTDGGDGHATIEDAFVALIGDVERRRAA